MERFIYDPSVLQSVTLTSDVGGLVSFDDVVRVQETNGQKYAVLNLTEKLAEILTSISAIPTTAAVNDAVSNALTSGKYVQESALKTITVNNGTPQSLLKSGNDTTINITTGSGSGSGSTVTYTPDSEITNIGDDYKTNIGKLSINGSELNITIPEEVHVFGMSNSTSSTDVIKYGISNMAMYPESGIGVIVVNKNSAHYFIEVKRLYANYISPKLYRFVVSGFIKKDNYDNLDVDLDPIYRKYIVQYRPATDSTHPAEWIPTLIFSSDQFSYDSNNKTLSITTE